MSAPAAAGHETRVSYLFEDNGFASAPNDSTDKPFGRDATLSTLEASNNEQRLYHFGTRTADTIVELGFSGSWTAEFILSASEWLAALYDTPTETDNTDYTTREYLGTTPQSLQITQSTPATGEERTLSGCVVTSMSLDINADDTASVTLEGVYADDTNDPDASSSGGLKSQPSVSPEPMRFAEADLKRSGSSLDMTQGSASLTINNGTELLYGFGQRTPTSFAARAQTVDLTHSRVVQGESDLQTFYGNSADSVQDKIDNSTDLSLVFTNGESAADQLTITFDISNCLTSSHSRSGIGDESADLMDELSMAGASSSATVDIGDNLTV
jgi:hypothetical protein